MIFEQIVNRLTGISCPIFGISWNPSTSERTIARQIISHLEMCRILYSCEDLYNYSTQLYCEKSVLKIKRYLMEKREEMIGNSIKEESLLYVSATHMVESCNWFLEKCQVSADFFPPLNWSFIASHSLLGNISDTLPCTIGYYELKCFRYMMGFAVGQIAVSHGLSVEGDLAKFITSTPFPPQY